MKQKIMVLFFLCFLSLSFISAETKIEIHTIPNNQLFITEIDAYSGSANTPVAQPFSTFTGETGVFVLDYTPKKSVFKLGFLLKDGNIRTIGYNVFDELMHEGKLINITFLPDDKSVQEMIIPSEEEEVTEEVDETTIEDNQTNVEDTNETVVGGDVLDEEENEDEFLEESETNETSPGFFKSAIMQGSAVLHDNKPIVNIVSYCLVAVILAVPIFLFVKKHKGKIANHVGKIGDMLPDKSDKKDSGNKEDFEKAEEDLKKARERIEELKGDKIKKAREKLLEDEKELMRLRKLGKD